MASTWLLILGDQLFEPAAWQSRLGGRALGGVFLREDRELCTRHRFHVHKLIFFLAALRTYADELRGLGLPVCYQSFDPTCPARDGRSEPEEAPYAYEERLVRRLRQARATRLCFFEIEDKFLERRLLDALRAANIEAEVWPSPMFLTSRAELAQLLPAGRRPFMKTFYERQRHRLDVLLDAHGEPVGGRMSFDAENRKALPATVKPPPLPTAAPSQHVQAVQRLCAREFATHPGDPARFWLPVERAGARAWLASFVAERLARFGPYQDALPAHSDFVFHSVLTPFLNTGLLAPAEVLEAALRAYESGRAPIESTEGFVRQVIGWREFVRGVYRVHSERQETTNFFGHTRQLAPVWYEGGTGLPPLDRALDKTLRYGFAHHIERLMVFGSLMLLLEVEPRAAHRWFMELFIDSTEWVMGPNVYGMALFSDGGVFATKPYICGSSYYGKMGPDKKGGPWKDEVDGLYWGFIERHRGHFLKNPRMCMAVRSLERMAPDRRVRLSAAAERVRERLTR